MAASSPTPATGWIMERDQSNHLYAVLFDERSETWMVHTGSARSIPLSRESLQHLVSLYNDIHRGAALTLIDRRALQELGAERRALQDKVRSLYTYIDDEAACKQSLTWVLADRCDALASRLRRVVRAIAPRKR